MTSPLIDNFNAGEFSPMLAGRVTFEKYPNASSLLQNFIPTTQGPIVRRGGTRFVHEVKNSANRALLIPFEFSVTQAYMLEFGDLYVRFYTWDAVSKVRGILESAPGVPVEVATPYTSAQLFNTDGTPRVKAVQSGDFLYLVHDFHQPRILKRITATSFMLELFESKSGPWQDLVTAGATITASAETGTVTVTASAAIFVPAHVGGMLYLESNSVSTVPAWEVGKVVAIGDRRRSDGKTYEATTAGTTGTNRPVHTEGTLADGDPGVSWAFRDPGYGHVRIIGFTDAQNVTATVIDRLPLNAATGTQRYAFSVWSNAAGWPNVAAFYKNRLWFAKRQTVWGSVSDDFTDFSSKSFGEVTADMAITVQINSRKINDIQWLSPDRDLIAGTAGGEFGIAPQSNSEPMGPSNRQCRPLSEFGSRAIDPVKNGESVLFVHRSGLTARETFYDFGSDGYKSTDATVLAEHITFTGLTQMAFASDPYQIVWAIRNDGLLVGFTWNNEQNVRGWHPHPIGGAGVVESIGVMPAAEGDRSELWLVVRRTINGVTRRYVEYMERYYRRGDTQASQFYVDSGLTYSGPATTTVTGLDHLEGATVSILVNGAPHPDRVVTGGTVTLQLPATVAQIGYACPCKYRSMRIEAGARDGTAQGKTKRIQKFVGRFQDTGGGTYGALVDGAFMDPFLFRKPNDPMNLPAPLYTGDKVVSWPRGYDGDGYLGYENDQPTAATLVAFMPQITTIDTR